VTVVTANNRESAFAGILNTLITGSFVVGLHCCPSQQNMSMVDFGNGDGFFARTHTFLREEFAKCTPKTI
jgi:hypothetical protein